MTDSRNEPRTRNHDGKVRCYDEGPHLQDQGLAINSDEWLDKVEKEVLFAVNAFINEVPRNGDRLLAALKPLIYAVILNTVERYVLSGWENWIDAKQMHEHLAETRLHNARVDAFLEQEFDYKWRNFKESFKMPEDEFEGL